MKVTMKTILAGPTLRAQPGQTIDVPDAVGSDLVAGGYAVEVLAAPVEPPLAKEDATVETATAPPAPETATAPAAPRAVREKRKAVK